MKSKTTIIVSHDLNLIRGADRIVVLKEGQIEQVGTHKSLLEDGGLYANLYAKQFGLVEAERGVQSDGALTVANGIEDADDEEDEPLSSASSPSSAKPFETLLMQALPLPVTPQVFQTIMHTQLETKEEPEPEPVVEKHIDPAADGQAAAEADESASARPAAFRTSVMRVLPRRGAPHEQNGDNK
jgi:ABC-type proline/glycine betaine transport system ATPase subunit